MGVNVSERERSHTERGAVMKVLWERGREGEREGKGGRESRSRAVQVNAPVATYM